MPVKLEWLGYRMVEKLWRHVKPFSYNTSVSRTDGQTDGRTELLYQYRASAAVCWRAIKTTQADKLTYAYLIDMLHSLYTGSVQIQYDNDITIYYNIALWNRVHSESSNLHHGWNKFPPRTPIYIYIYYTSHSNKATLDIQRPIIHTLYYT